MAMLTDNPSKAAATSDVATSEQKNGGGGPLPFPLLSPTEADLVNVARMALVAWRQNPNFTLLHATPADLEAKVNTFEQAMMQRNATRGARYIVTPALTSLNLEINTGIAHLKAYITAKYTKKCATAYYEQFGIVKRAGHGVYQLPVDKDARLLALQRLSAAVDESPFAKRPYGSKFWKDILARYAVAKHDAERPAVVLAKTSLGKKGIRGEIRCILNSLIYLLRANYPESWRKDMRAWGFMKAKY